MPPTAPPPAPPRPAPQSGAVALRQQQRSFAEAAVATRTTIWDELGELVTSDEGKRELATLRSTYVDIASKLAEMAKVRACECVSVRAVVSSGRFVRSYAASAGVPGWLGVERGWACL